MAKNDIVVMTSDDVYLTKGAVNSLTKILLSNDSIGMVGPLTRNVYSRQRTVFKPIKDYSKNEIKRIDSFAKFVRSKNLPQEKTDFLMGFCFGIKKSVCKKTLFDTDYKKAFWEDEQLCRDLIKSGYDLIIDQKTFVWHGGIKGSSASLIHVNFKKTAKIAYKNMKIYIKKNSWKIFIKRLIKGLIYYPHIKPKRIK